MDLRMNKEGGKIRYGYVVILSQDSKYRGWRFSLKWGRDLYTTLSV